MDPSGEPARAGPRDLALAIAVALLYYALTLGALSLAVGPGVMAGVWPQSGLALAAVLHVWPRASRVCLVLALTFVAHVTACLQVEIRLEQALALGVADIVERPPGSCARGAAAPSDCAACATWPPSCCWPPAAATP